MRSLRGIRIRAPFWLLASGLPLAAAPLAAQADTRAPRDTIYIYQVEIPEAAVRSPVEAPRSCVVRATDPERIIVDTVGATPKDTLWVRVVRVEGTTRTTVRPPVDLDVYVGAKRKTMVTSMDSMSMTEGPRQLAGKRVTVQEPNTGRVFCSLTLPPVNATATTPARRLRFPQPDVVVSVGASFDLLTGLRANDLYSDVRAFIPGLWDGPGADHRIGFQAGVYQGRISESPAEDTVPPFSVVSPVTPLDTAGGLLVRVRTYQPLHMRRQNTLGLYLGLNMGIAPDLYLVAPHFEIRREHLRDVRQDSLIGDTLGRVPLGHELPEQRRPGTRSIRQTAYVPSSRRAYAWT